MRVLLVEDEVGIANAVRRGLTAEGFVVDVEHDGLGGLHQARENEYAAIILDIMLPGMNGYVVCRTLRDEEVWTPILMLTAKNGEFDETEALDTGADDFLSKPFSFPVLLARIRALARRGSSPRPTVLAAGDLRLDPATRDCYRGDQRIELTVREFSLLQQLLSANGAAVEKRALLDAVWGTDPDDANVVEVYVGYLRKKVDVPFGRKTLVTVRGVGYRIDANG